MRYDLIENGKRTRFIYHNGELLYEKGGETKQSKEETSYQLGAGIEALQRNQKTYYYHQDEQLNTALITNRKGEIKNQYQYDAYGNGLETIEELPNRIRYTGQQYDQQTEQYYLRARYYNPIVGRFIQEDVYQGDGLNLYIYCRNNPVVYYDPSGYMQNNINGISCGEARFGENDESGREIISVTQDRLQHSTLGEFNSNGRLINGGHGQANIDYLDANGIPYNIVTEYPNGVRVGNIPNHKNKFKRTGTGQAWFPKNWTDTDIKNAGEYVVNLPANRNVSDGTWMFGEYNDVRVGVIKNNGEIGTIIPDNSRQP